MATWPLGAELDRYWEDLRLGLRQLVAKPAFAVAAVLTLALVGLYAVMRYAVVQRRRELGVRLALGATPGDLSRLVLKDAFRVLAIGLVLGRGTTAIASSAGGGPTGTRR